jgi:hypothetical protein
MDSPFLEDLAALLRETEVLLTHPEPQTDAWEDYRRTREAAFLRLEAADAWNTTSVEERAKLRELIEAILQRDQLLVQRLEEYLSVCRDGLSRVPKTQQALKGYFPRERGSLQRQA